MLNKLDMKISIIIPTHNRAKQLKKLLKNIKSLKENIKYECIVVDNNSIDETKKIVKSFRNVKYVFEGSTSFTKARGTGEKNAKGDILLYIDDDVIVRSGSLKEIIRIFKKYPRCGVIAGRVLPRFTSKPSSWVLELQKNFNGWSLYNEDQYSHLKKGFQEVRGAAGPMMAIRHLVYKLVHGFPPDTIGVETNKYKNSFSKLYIGPGDFGFCYNIIKKDYKIYYAPKVSVYHIIPKIRFTIPFWRSRVIGEGYCIALINRKFYKLGNIDLNIKKYNCINKFADFEKKFLKTLKSTTRNGMSVDEMFLWYHKAYLDMDFILKKYPQLGDFLWDIGRNGVDNNNYKKVIKQLPPKYLNLIDNKHVYNPKPIKNINDYNRYIKNQGYVSQNPHHLYGKKFINMIIRGLQIFKGLSDMNQSIRTNPI